MVNLDEELKCWPKASLEEITREAFRVDDGGLRQKLAHFVFEARNAQTTAKLLDEQRAAVAEMKAASEIQARTARYTLALAVGTFLLALGTFWIAYETRQLASAEPPPIVINLEGEKPPG